MQWPEIPRHYALPSDEVHVFRTGLHWSHERIRELRETLSSDEREKADSFHFEIDRRRHVVGRGLLRLILAHLLETQPTKVRFEYSAFGKPSLSSGWPEMRLQFNLSHSGDVVLLALTIGRAVGIDVERVRIGLAVDGIARHFFSVRERSELATLDAGRRPGAFFTCWTRKEAFIKANGKGLSMPLNEFDVSLLLRHPATVLATRPDSAQSGRWVLQDLDVGPGYKAAIAVERSDWHLKTWQWSAVGCSPFGPPPASKAQ